MSKEKLFLLDIFKLFQATRSSLVAAPIMPNRKLRAQKQPRSPVAVRSEKTVSSHRISPASGKNGNQPSRVR
jgi:hypothetical protein